MSSNLIVLLKKFGIPVLFTFSSIALLIVGLMNDQEAPYFIAVIMMILASILSILFSAGILSYKISVAVGGVSLLLALLAVYLGWTDIDDTLDYTAKSEKAVSLAQQNLSDIRDIQKLHFTQTGKYLATWEEFENYLKTGKIQKVNLEGTVPARKITEAERTFLYNDKRSINENMTETEAYRLSKWRDNPNYSEFIGFVRDTTDASILETKYTNNKTYKKLRFSKDFPVFNAQYVDSLKFIPYTNGKKKWKLEIRDGIKVGDGVTQAIRISGELPFNVSEWIDKPIFLSIGTLDKNNIDMSSWDEK